MNKIVANITDTLYLLCVKYRKILYSENAWNIDSMLGMAYDSFSISENYNIHNSYFVGEIEKDKSYDRILQELLVELDILHEKFADLGISIYDAMKMLPAEYSLSTLTVKMDGTLFFPDYNKSILLTPIQATIYMFLLMHEEGVDIKDLPDYQEELSVLFSSILRARGKNINPKRIERNVERIIDATSGSINENISRIKRILLDLLVDNRIARNYYINSLRLHKMRIPLDRQMVNILR